MISFTVDSRYVLDLQDDVMVNEDLTLYEFIGKDPVKAFYMGYNLAEWFKELNKKQQYLYSKQARHNKDGLEKYQSQIEFWTNRFPSKEENISLTDLSEYIINNMLWDEKTKEIDKVKLAFFFGDVIAQQNKKTEEEQKIPNQEK